MDTTGACTSDGSVARIVGAKRLLSNRVAHFFWMEIYFALFT
jgi:hypothetical protein